jgi:hypothetical protein
MKLQISEFRFQIGDWRCTKLGPYEIVAPLGAGRMGELCDSAPLRAHLADP